MNTNMMQLSKFVKWSVAGDGCVSYSTHNTNAHYSITRSPEHLDYINIVLSKFDGLQDCTTNVAQYTRKDNGKTVISLRTNSHPLFSRVRERQYLQNRRIIDKHMLTMLDWEAASFLYMDDGSLCVNNKGSHIVRLSTCAYSEIEQEALRKAFIEKLGVVFNVNRTGKNLFQLNLATKDHDKWFDGVEKFIVDSYKYKLPKCLQKGTSRTEDNLV